MRTKAKGNRAEAAVVQALRDAGLPANKIMFGPRMKADIELFDLDIEVKCHSRSSVPVWWDQAVKKCRPGRVPVLVWRISSVSRQGESFRAKMACDGGTILLDWNDFVDYLKANYETEKLECKQVDCPGPGKADAEAHLEREEH